MKNVVNRIHLKINMYPFNMKMGTIEHLDSFTKLLANLVGYDEIIGDEEKTLCSENSPLESMTNNYIINSWQDKSEVQGNCYDINLLDNQRLFDYVSESQLSS